MNINSPMPPVPSCRTSVLLFLFNFLPTAQLNTPSHAEFPAIWGQGVMAGSRLRVWTTITYSPKHFPAYKLCIHSMSPRQPSLLIVLTDYDERLWKRGEWEGYAYLFALAFPSPPPFLFLCSSALLILKARANSSLTLTPWGCHISHWDGTATDPTITKAKSGRRDEP